MICHEKLFKKQINKCFATWSICEPRDKLITLARRCSASERDQHEIGIVNSDRLADVLNNAMIKLDRRVTIT